MGNAWARLADFSAANRPRTALYALCPAGYDRNASSRRRKPGTVLFRLSLSKRGIAVVPSPPPVPTSKRTRNQNRYLWPADSLTELQIIMPQEFDGGRDSMEQFFSCVALCHEPIAFELLGIQKKVMVQFACASPDAEIVRRQLLAFFPDIQVKALDNALLQAWNPHVRGKKNW